MDKIIENIYNMSEREYDVFKFLVVTLLIAVAVTVYFTLRIPGQLAERERIIEQWNIEHAQLNEELNKAYGDAHFTPGVIYYDSAQ
ncbi:MAG: hypothetical protein IK012_05125 [Fibrobacter sp.]|uniref:hypothetical protein n=1 Tax=Fibrobacter sp. TaxID=35828 RepID=UPI0025BB28E0|nr:hypothetical protein [Fibrobacter sp.]MBR4784620.1 hypothetical protein [Fibrobacter sp.]